MAAPTQERNGRNPTPDARSIVRAELARIAQRFEAADRRAKAAGVAVAFGAGTVADREAAEAERRDAAGESWAAESDLADLLLLLLRHARRHQPDALRDLLADVLRPELAPLAEAVARLEARR